MNVYKETDIERVRVIANKILKNLSGFVDDDATVYAALGLAFSEKHFSLGNTIKDWEEITGDMVEIFNRMGKK